MAYGIHVARFTFHYDDENGQPRTVAKGALVREGHPMLDGREELFEPLTVDYEHERVAPKAPRTPTRKT